MLGSKLAGLPSFRTGNELALPHLTVRLTKCRSVAMAKKRVQIVLANIGRASVAGYVFEIAGHALPLDALLSFERPVRRGPIPCWSPLAAAVSQRWADLGADLERF